MLSYYLIFFFNDPATTEIYTLSLHDALPIYAMGGVAISQHEADGDSLVRVMKYVGGVLSPWDAHEILRGIKTLAVRMERHCENASAVAAWLSKDARVAHVHYPGLESGARNEIASRILRAPYFGALVSIELKDNSREAAFRF